jgi:hypothetical protein
MVFSKNLASKNKAIAPAKDSALDLDAPQEEKKERGSGINTNWIIMYLENKSNPAF